MATLTNTKIKDTYDGLLKTNDNGVLGVTSKEITDGLGNGSGIYIGTNERLGVGTSSPVSPIDVVSDANATGITLRGRSADNIGTFNFSDNAGNVSSQIQDRDGQFHITTLDTSPILFNTAASERIRIDENGNVGIGQSTMIGTAAGRVALTIGGSTSAVLNFGNAGTRWGGLYAGSGDYAIYSDSLMRFETSGTERMRIDSSGNVGIGRSSISQPSAGATTLAIQGTSTDKSGAIRLYSSNDSIQAFIYADATNGLSINTTTSHPMVFRTAGTERMRIDASGNVGIGIVPSGAKMHIYDSTGTATTLLKLQTGWNNPSGNKSIVWSDAGGDTARISVDYSAPMFKMRFGSIFNSGYQTGDAMVIQGNGNVGIGTSSLNSISGSNPTLTLAGTGLSGGLILQNSGTDTARIYETGNLLIHQGMTGVGQSFYVNSAVEAMRIDSSGNVKINGSGRLQMRDDGSYIYEDNGLNIGNGGTGTGRSINFLTENTERMRIDASGRVLQGYTSGLFLGFGAENFSGLHYSGGSTGGYTAINSDSSNAPLYLSKTSGSPTGVIINFASNGSGVGAITITGSSTSYNTSSDYRLKEDWQPMANALDRVEALKPINFAWKVDGSRVDGFLAHELQEVIPEAVTGEKDATEEYEITPAVLDLEGNVIEEAVMGTRDVYQGIDQSKIVPLLVAAIQELRAEIELLKN